METDIVMLVFRILAEVFNRKEPKPEPKNNGDTNVIIIINGDINH